MALSDLFKPKWKHSDPAVRLSAIDAITDEKMLAAIIRESDSFLVCEAATRRLTDQDMLADIALNCRHPQARTAAVEKLDDMKLVVEVALEDVVADVRISAVSRLSDPKVLRDVALNDEDADVRRAAAEKITDQETLADIVRNDGDEFVAKAAMQKLSGQNALADIARKGNNASVRIAAVEKMTDQNVLADIAGNDENEKVRLEATRRITDQGILVDIMGCDDSSRVRWTAAERITDPNILTDAATNSEDVNVRYVATRKITSRKTLSDIALNDASSDVRLAATNRITDEKILSNIAGKDESSEVRHAATELLTDQEVLADIAKNDEDPKVRCTATRKITSQKILSGIAVNDDSGDVRRIAIEKLTDRDLLARLDETEPIKLYLEELTARQAVNHLAYLLKDSSRSRNVRFFAIETLGRIGDENAIKKLSDILNPFNTPDEWWHAAARALGEAGGDSAVTCLLQCFFWMEKCPAIIVKSLVRIGGAASKRLVKVAETRDFDGRHVDYEYLESVARILSKIGDATSINGLVNMLKSENDAVRKIASAYLKEDVVRSSDTVAEIHYCIEKRNLDRIVAIGPDAVAPLVKVLNSSYGDPRLFSIMALGRIGGEGAANELMALLNNEDDMEVIKTVLKSLETCKDKFDVVVALVNNCLFGPISRHGHHSMAATEVVRKILEYGTDIVLSCNEEMCRECSGAGTVGGIYDAPLERDCRPGYPCSACDSTGGNFSMRVKITGEGKTHDEHYYYDYRGAPIIAYRSLNSALRLYSHG